MHVVVLFKRSEKTNCFSLGLLPFRQHPNCRYRNKFCLYWHYLSNVERTNEDRESVLSLISFPLLFHTFSLLYLKCLRKLIRVVIWKSVSGIFKSYFPLTIIINLLGYNISHNHTWQYCYINTPNETSWHIALRSWCFKLTLWHCYSSDRATEMCIAT